MSQSTDDPGPDVPKLTELESDASRGQFWCPSCSAALIGRSCKLRCTRCGYFEDCSNLI